MKIKPFSLIVLSILTIGLLGSCGQKEETLTVGLECNYAPFNWTEITETDKNLPVDGKANQYADGYDIQMAKKLGEKLNLPVVIKKLKWDSLIPSLNNGEINAVIAGMTDTEERRLSISFTDEYYRSELVLLVKSSDYTDKVLSADDFKVYIEGKKIESQISTVTDELINVFVDNYGALHNKPVDSFPSAANDVVNGVAFAMTAELPVATSLAASNKNLSIVRIDQTILGEEASKLGVSIGVRKDDNALREKINTALSTIDSDERLALMNDAISRSGDGVDITDDETTADLNSFEKISYLLSNYWKTFLSGLLSTLILAIIGSLVGLLIGVLVAIGKNVKVSSDDNWIIKFFKRLLKGLVTIYSVVLRGTPMMVQALIFKFACLAIGINFGDFLTGVPVFDGWLVCGLIVITLNTGAYMGEDVQAGLNGLDKGQKEAALALGMNKFKSFVCVILPQALRNCLPTLANEYIINVKDSSVLNVISVTELFLSVSIATSKNYFIVEGYIIIAAIYLILTLIATGIFKLVTNKIDGKPMKVHLFRRTPAKLGENN